MHLRRRAGLEMSSPGGLGQDLFVDRQIRDRSTELLILLLELLQFLELSSSHAAILLSPAVIGLFCDTHLPDRINTHHSLPNQYINLAQLCDNLFGFVALVGHIQSSFYSTIGWTNSKGEDHGNGFPNLVASTP